MVPILNSGLNFIMEHFTASALTPDPELRRHIEEAVHAESHMCWTCRSCANECPVNLASGRLQPIKIAWMANLGLLDELLWAPEIWYCQQCNRCNQICPMKVKPDVPVESHHFFKESMVPMAKYPGTFTFRKGAFQQALF
jgi:heterodisulfide reductase subunit C